MKLGFVSDSLGGMGFEMMLDHTARLGVAGVEVNTGGWSTAPHFDHDSRTFAIYRGPADDFFCTDGLCTHEEVHLADGLVMEYAIECPKHASMFDYRTGEVETPPACEDLNTYPTKVENGRVMVEI